MFPHQHLTRALAGAPWAPSSAPWTWRALTVSHNLPPQILDTIRRTVEDCDSLQSFLLLHSLGGGTGSGVGTYILELLAVGAGGVFGRAVHA